MRVRGESRVIVRMSHEEGGAESTLRPIVRVQRGSMRAVLSSEGFLRVREHLRRGKALAVSGRSASR